MSKIIKESPQELLYYGNHCVTRYWVYNEELGLISGGRIPSKYDDLALELQARKIVESMEDDG
jgi:hypothetical protein